MPRVEVQPELSKHYEEYYTGGPSEWRRIGAMDKCANIVDLCERLPHRSVLEIGAGDGSLLSRLSDLGFGEELHAVEISTSGVDVIKSRKIPRLVECALFDGYHLSYGAAQFDLAILSHVIEIEHVEHPRLLLYEAARVARYVFVEVPTEDISRRDQDYVTNSVGHINFFSPRTIRWLVQSSGLRVLSQVTTNPSKETYAFEGRFGSWRYQIKRHLLRWAPALATRHFCYHEALVATGLSAAGDPPASSGAPTTP